MLKFWKKKPAETPPGQPAAPVADEAPAEGFTRDTDAASLDQGTPALDEALAETPPRPELPAEDEAFEREAIAETAVPAKRSWRERLSGSTFARGLSSLFVRHPKLDDDLLDELETTLITADVGIEASTTLVEDLRKRMHKREFADAAALLTALRQSLIALLKPVEQPLDVTGHKPFVVLTVGINGAGKTTTIGKLARRYRDDGRQVMLAAGDTFRAAAIGQLRTWAERVGVPIVTGPEGGDAAGVVWDAVKKATETGIDVLIVDTAGRLQNKRELMDELAKIRRVLGRINPASPHDVVLVLDATTGQNALSQIEVFKEVAGVTGLVMTKLDGTARGGVLVAAAEKYGLPIHAIGVGEGMTDLRPFDANEVARIIAGVDQGVRK
jgi:fused signal recognition particle receptor